MDAFDYKEDPASQKPKRTTRGLILNLGALYFLASGFCLIGFFIYTYLSPNNPYNPFPPATQVPVLTTPTYTLPPTQTPIFIPSATFTLPPTNTATATLDFTDTPTATAEITLSPTLEEGPTLTLTATTSSAFHFVPQSGTPVYAPYPDGCDGIYIVGNVIDSGGNPLLGMVADAGGSLGNATISPTPATSGDNPEFSPSGWLIKISDELIASTNSVYVALYNAGSTTAVSDLVFVETYDDCDHNMIMVNFTQSQ